jgi:hypothetical protein
MTRLQQLLAGLLALQLLLIGIVFWPRSAAGDGGGPLLAGFTPDEVVGLHIEDQTAAEVVLAREDAQWVLANGSDYPADEAKIAALLEKLAALQSNRLVARTPTSHRRLQVAEDDFVRRVELTLADGESLTLFVGRAPTAQATHVRLAGQDETYLVDNLANWEVNATLGDWIDTAYITLDRNSITSLTVENGNGLFEFQKEGETWNYPALPEGETFDEATLNTLISRIVNLQMVEPLGSAADPAYGLDEPRATVTVTAANAEGEEETHTLAIGNEETESENTVVKWSGSPYYVRVASFNMQAIIDQTADDFLQAAAETPTPEDAGE